MFVYLLIFVYFCKNSKLNRHLAEIFAWCVDQGDKTRKSGVENDVSCFRQHKCIMRMKTVTKQKL